MTKEASYRDGREHPSLSLKAAARQGAGTPLSRRLSPSELHDMRVAWGKKWGKLISDATAHMREDRKEGQ